MQKIVNDAYKASISKNHSWLIRKTATLAFHVLPSRSTLISRIGPNYTEEMVRLTGAYYYQSNRGILLIRVTVACYNTLIV